MAKSKSVLKRQRQMQARRLRNRVVLTRLKTLIKQAKSDLQGNDPNTARDAVRTAVSGLDKAASKGVIHKNKAARLNARLSRRLHRRLAAVPQASGQASTVSQSA